VRSIAGIRSGVVAGAAALAMSVGTVAHAQQTQQEAAPLTEAQAAGVKRLHEVIEVLNTGDYATIRAYFEENSVVPPAPPGMTNPPDVMKYPWGTPQFSRILITYRHSRGLDLIRVTTVPDSGIFRDIVAGIVRNRLTGDEDYLAVRVEPQPPHRIIAFPIVFPEVSASWKLQRSSSVAATEQERIEEIGSYLKRLEDADIFSGTVIIARDGEPVFAQAYGYADRERKIPNTLETPFLLASMTKLFTGLAIGQLVEQGRLSYDDPLSKFLPDFPDPESAKKIQIKHLLSHTSGLALALGDRISDSASSEVLDGQTTVKAMVDAFGRDPLVFEPGAKSDYSNMGFVLLGRIIEIVTGEDYYDYMLKNVFAPAGATSASFPILPANGVAVVPMAYPYEAVWDQEDLRETVVNQLGKDQRRGGPSCCSIASALDLLSLSNAMKAGQIVTPETLRLHSTPKPELTRTIYGYGFATRARRADRPLVGHGGNSGGTCTEFGELRDTPYTIIVLSNLTINKCMEVTERILRVLRPSEEPAQQGSARDD
jgi:CubicO group peptidase (beta-lactamase class C family)